MLIDKHWCTSKFKHTALLLQRKECIACFLPSRRGTDMVNSLVTFVLSVWWKTTPAPPLDTYSMLVFFFFFSQSVEAIFLEDVHVDFTKSFDVVGSNLY